MLDLLNEELVRKGEEALEYGFAAVCVNPVHVARAAEVLKGSDVETCTVVGFPLGAMLREAKAAEAAAAVNLGADELDMVMNVGKFLSGDDDWVRRDIEGVVAETPERLIICGGDGTVQ